MVCELHLPVRPSVCLAHLRVSCPGQSSFYCVGGQPLNANGIRNWQTSLWYRSSPAAIMYARGAEGSEGIASGPEALLACLKLVMVFFFPLLLSSRQTDLSRQLKRPIRPNYFEKFSLFLSIIISLRPFPLEI